MVTTLALVWIVLLVNRLVRLQRDAVSRFFAESPGMDRPGSLAEAYARFPYPLPPRTAPGNPARK
jgi:hypothetical protein